MSASAVRAGGAFVEIFAKDGQFHQAMSRIQARMQRTATAMQNVGRQLALGAAMVGAPMVMALGQFTAFDDAIRMTGAVSQATAPELAALTEKARELGATTSFTAAQVATLMAELGRAGFKPQEIEAMTGAVLNLARATGTDATMSAGIMAATLRQFGLGAEDATRVSDVLTGAANKTFNTVEALGEALSYAGVNAAQAGMSIEETAAVLGTLGNVGIQGSNAGTALRRLLTITGAEAQRLKEIFGVSFLDAAGNVRPLVDTLGEVAQATSGLASGEKMARFNAAFGLLGITSATAISTVVADTRKLTDELYAAGGSAAKTAQQMDAGLGGSMRILWSATEGVSIAFGTALAPSLQLVAKGATAAADAIRSLINRFPIAAQLVAGVTGGVFVLGVAAIAGGMMLKVLASGLGLVASAAKLIPLLFTPAGAAIAGIAASVAIAVAAARTLSPAFRSETDAIMAAVYRMDFAPAWQIMNTNVAIALKIMAGYFGDLWLELKNGALDAATYIGDQLAGAVNTATGWSGWKPFETLGSEGRQELSDKRKQDADAHREFRQATIDTLRDDLKRLHDKAREMTTPADTSQAGGPGSHGRPPTSMPIGPLGPLAAAAGEAAAGAKAATVAGFSSNIEGIGIGPQLDAAMRTADATDRMAARLDGIDTALQQTAEIAKGQEATTTVHRDMLSTSEKILSEIASQSRILKDLLAEARQGGLRFS